MHPPHAVEAILIWALGTPERFSFEFDVLAMYRGGGVASKRQRIKKPTGCLHRDALPVQFGLSRAAANGAAGRNA